MSDQRQVDVVLPEPGEPLRLMAVHAHPDDESSKGAASTAMYVSQGVEVLVVTCTGGERGDILNKALHDDPAVVADLAGVRRREMELAAQILGVQHAWLGYLDSGLPEPDENGVTPALPEDCFAVVPVEISGEPLVTLIREFRPHVVTTYDENGGYPHPDHIQTHVITMYAVDAAASPEVMPQAGPAWQTVKVYYQLGFHKQKLIALHEAALEETGSSPFAEWLEEWDDRPEDQGRLTTQVECAQWFDVRDLALKAHATQVDPEGDWFGISHETQRRVWPTEDYQLARTHIEIDVDEHGIERDLFTGLRAAEDNMSESA